MILAYQFCILNEIYLQVIVDAIVEEFIEANINEGRKNPDLTPFMDHLPEPSLIPSSQYKKLYSARGPSFVLIFVFIK